MMNNHSHFEMRIRLTRLFRIFPYLALAGIFILPLTPTLAEDASGTTTITNDQMDAILHARCAETIQANHRQYLN
jgi:hypothetical protein